MLAAAAERSYCHSSSGDTSTTSSSGDEAGCSRWEVTFLVVVFVVVVTFGVVEGVLDARNRVQAA